MICQVCYCCCGSRTYNVYIEFDFGGGRRRGRSKFWGVCCECPRVFGREAPERGNWYDGDLIAAATNSISQLLLVPPVCVCVSVCVIDNTRSRSWVGSSLRFWRNRQVNPSHTNSHVPWPQPAAAKFNVMHAQSALCYSPPLYIYIAITSYYSTKSLFRVCAPLILYMLGFCTNNQNIKRK